MNAMPLELTDEEILLLRNMLNLYMKSVADEFAHPENPLHLDQNERELLLKLGFTEERLKEICSGES
jgi:hypothetical protein